MRVEACVDQGEGEEEEEEEAQGYGYGPGPFLSGRASGLDRFCCFGEAFLWEEVAFGIWLLPVRGEILKGRRDSQVVLSDAAGGFAKDHVSSQQRRGLCEKRSFFF